MSWVWKLLVGMALFLFFLVLRFPYETAVKRSLYEISQATGVQIAWDGQQAGPLGVELRNVHIMSPGGAHAEFLEARLHPTFGGLVAYLKQADGGSASLSLDSSRKLAIDAKAVKVDTGNESLGQALISVKNFKCSLVSREGKGDVGMVLPKLNVPLPIPLGSIELGAPVQIHPAKPGPGLEVSAEVRLSGDKLSGAGNVEVKSLPGQSSPKLSGVLDIEAGNIKGSVRLGGTWAKPSWNLNPASR